MASSNGAEVHHARREGQFPKASYHYHQHHPSCCNQKLEANSEEKITDAPAILELIQALADYERESDAVQATVSTLENTIAFAPSPSSSTTSSTAASSATTTTTTSPSRPARCLLLFNPSNTPVGMALYFYNYSTWRSKPGIYLEDLFVQPAERGKGYGKKLLVELAKEVVAMEGARLEWSVLKWNEPSIKFYESIGAKGMTEWLGMRVDGPALDQLAKMLD